MSWDEILSQYDHIRIRSLLGGRIRIGYPPSVLSADVNLTGGRLLSDGHLIGRVVTPSGTEWSFALPCIREEAIKELPCRRRAIFDDWIIDAAGPAKIDEHPAVPLRGIVTASEHGRVLLYNLWRVACFDKSGLAWTSRGLFDAEMTSVKLIDGRIACYGYLGWIDPDKQFELLLDPATGEVVGGDGEAVDIYGA